MKAGWKNRIEERMYFEGKKRDHIEQCAKMKAMRMMEFTDSMYREVMDEFRTTARIRSHEPDHR